MDKTYIYIFCFFLVLISSTDTYSQDENRNKLLSHIHKECPLISHENTSFCDSIDFIELDRKYLAYQGYLVERLSELVLVDSSTYYQSLSRALQNLEEQKGAERKSNEKLKKEFENYYLILSLIRPLSSEPYFRKLLEFNLDIDTINIEVYQLESFLYYRAWLLDILINRFRNEPNSFEKRKEIMFYNQITEDIILPYTNISEERDRINILREWSVIATKGNYLADYPTYQDLLSICFLIRAQKANDSLKVKYTDELFSFIEGLYLEAQNLKSDDANVRYSLGVFYYNTSLYMNNNPDLEVLSKRKQKQREKQSEELREKGIFLVKETGAELFPDKTEN